MMLFCFQAQGADVRMKQAPSQSVTPRVIKQKPTEGLQPATPAKPDLVVLEFDLMPTTAQNMVPNSELSPYKLVIKNNGGPSNVSQMLVAFHDSPHSGRSDYMAVPGPGQSLTFSGELWVPVDQCMAVTYEVILDAHHQVDESNENNNTASASVAVEHRPDVGFCKNPSICQEKFINGGVNNQIYIGLEVYNYGCAISPACSMDLNFPEQWPLNVPIPPISPGKFFPYHTYMTWTNPGVKMGEIIIRNAINDARDFNDRVKFKVNVVQP
jgi:hypothetical protein